MQTVYYRSIRQATITELERPKRGSWVHCVDPSDDELAEVAVAHGFDTDLLEDAVDLYESPRLEHEAGITYIYTRYSWPEGTETSTQPLLIAVTPDLIVTISRRSPEPVEQLLASPATITTQKIKLIVQILEQITAGYRRDVNQITKQIFASRSRLQRKIVNDNDIIRFIYLEEDLNEFLTALESYGGVLKTLSSGRYFHFHEADIDMLEDLVLSTNELIELTKNRLSTIRNLRDAYSTIAANNLNRIFKRLTSITIFLAIPTVIGGLLGMNIDLPMQHSPHAFWFVMGFIAVSLTLTVAYFRRKRWL